MWRSLVTLMFLCSGRPPATLASGVRRIVAMADLSYPAPTMFRAPSGKHTSSLIFLHGLVSTDLEARTTSGYLHNSFM